MSKANNMNDRIANDLIRYAELVEDGALISPEEMNCASLMRLAAEALAKAWVGLTDDEMWNAYTGGSDIINLDYAKAIEAKLKAKNERLEKNT